MTERASRSCECLAGQARVRGGALHNMCCPPRTVIAVRPLRIENHPAGCRSGVSRDPGVASGLRLVTRVSVDHLIRKWFPAFRVSGRDADVVHWAGRIRLRDPAADMASLRLRCLVVLSRLAVGDINRVTRQQVYGLAGIPVEALETAYLENTTRLEPRAYRLPAFGLVRPVDEKNAGACELEPARALAVLSRTAGTVFSAARTPVLPDHARHRPMLALFDFLPASGEVLHG